MRDPRIHQQLQLQEAMNMNKTHIAIMKIMAALTLPPCLIHAQDTSWNFVKTVTMLDAGGTDRRS